MSLSTTLNVFRERLQYLAAEASNLQARSNSSLNSLHNGDLLIHGASSSSTSPTPAQTQPSPPPTSLRPALPTEVLDIVFSMLTKEQLKPLLYTNSFVSALATQRLYHDVELARPALVVAFLKTVLKSERLPLLVRSLELNALKSETVKVGRVFPFSALHTGEGSAEDPMGVDSTPPLAGLSTGVATTRTFKQKTKALPTRNFYALLARGLRRMRGLVSLTLELPKAHAPLWIFDGCTFRLRQFTTSMYCRRPLARLLETQPGIVELTLRGYQTDSLALLPFMDPAGSAIVQGVTETRGLRADETFTLSPEAMPDLRVFNAVHADADLVRAVVEGRPVEVVSLPLFPERSIASLDALGASSVPLKRLSVISFDPTAPGFLFEALARRFVDVEALHLVLLMAEYDQEMLERSAVVLSNFKCLKYITFMAAPSRPTPPPPPHPFFPMPQTAIPPLTTPTTAPPTTTQTTPTNPAPFIALGPGPAPQPSSDTTNTNPHTGTQTQTETQTEEEEEEQASKNEADIAAQWHRACPTLRTIILPKGRVWFQSSATASSASAGAGGASGSASAGGSGSGSGSGGAGGSGSGGGGVDASVSGELQTPTQLQPQVVWSAL